jgi:hypothetical protein
MKRALTLAAGAALAATSLLTQAATVTSSFNSDNEGWTTLNNGGFVPVWVAADGLIRSDDIVEGWAYLAAPSAFLAVADYGALLSFDLSSASTSPGDVPVFPTYGVRVALVGAAGTLIAQAGTPPGPSLNGFSFSFDTGTDWRLIAGDPADFPGGAPVATQAEIEAVLGSLSGLFISADHSDFNTQVGGTDITQLDNVSLVSQDPGVVPEPASAALALAALVGLRLSRRRR